MSDGTLPMPALGDRVTVRLEGMVNAVTSDKADPQHPRMVMVFVPRAEWGQDFHGWPGGQNVWADLTDVVENRGPYTGEDSQ